MRGGVRQLKMETKKRPERKRRVNVRDDVNGEQTGRERARGSETAVTEEEVKEFFAILHRIRDGGGERTAKEGMGRWLPAFRLEDFGEAAEMGSEVSSGGGALRIDLNVEPETESREA